ncbi:MAG: hypothetical protein JET69_05545 [Methanomassiliicoccales archaeon]|nr:hypothetical protein [Methanomassiliicoccales archaeon]
MARPDVDPISFLKEMNDRLSQTDRKSIPYNDLGSFMGRDQNECKYAVAALRKLGYVELTAPNFSVVILNPGHEKIEHVYGEKIEYERLIAALESVNASMTDLGDIIQPLIDDIRNGKSDNTTTRMRVWDVADRILNSTVAATTMVGNLKILFGSV